MVDIHEKFISDLLDSSFIDERVFLRFQRLFASQHKVQFLHKDKLLRAYQKLLKNDMVARSQALEKILQTKNVRSNSGIAVVSVLTKPFPCPGQCIFCPTEVDVPKSYLSSEPAVMRAIANGYHPYKQVRSRLKALRDTGHNIDKISVRIIGGSWSSYSNSYQNWFIRQLYLACNDFSDNNISGKLDLRSLQTQNESATCRIVELSVETRQDMINNQELTRLRSYGVTKVELGVQSVDDEVLRLNKRGADTKATISATKLLKNFGFKVSYQMMLNLYGSSYDKDVLQYKEIFDNPGYRPDHMKIYPLALVENSSIYQLYKHGKFKPYDKETLVRLIADIKAYIPHYCRVERVIRDIPASHIVEGGSAVSNLRQEVEKELSKRGLSCRCIRCREIRGTTVSGDVQLQTEKYDASDGQEYFISINDTKTDKLIGFCRLRLPGREDKPAVLNDAAIIREIHVYGPSVQVGKREKGAQQHMGYGKMMIAAAEEIARERSFKKLAVISGVGVREYFRSLGYQLDKNYMTKMM